MGVCEQTVALFFQLTSDVLIERKKETPIHFKFGKLSAIQKSCFAKVKKTLVKIWYVQTYI